MIQKLILIGSLLWIAFPAAKAQGRPPSVPSYIPFAGRIAQMEPRLQRAGVGEKSGILDSLCELHWQQANFYYELWRSAVSVQRIYYETLDTLDGLSGVYRVYLGITRLEEGDIQSAVAELTRGTQSSDTPKGEAVLGKAWLGAAQVLAGQVDKGRAMWRELQKSTPAAQLEARFLASRFDSEWFLKSTVEKAVPKEPTPRMNRSLAFISCVMGDLGAARKYSFHMNPESPVYVEKKGTLQERVIYEPSALYVLYRVSLEACGAYADERIAGSVSGGGEPIQALYFRGAVYYKKGDLQKAVKFLRRSTDERARPYMAAAAIRTGTSSEANLEYQRCLEELGPEGWSRMGVLLSVADRADRERLSVLPAQKAVDAVLKVKKKDIRVPQELFSNLGKAQLEVGRLEEALATYHRGWNAGRADDLSANDPVFLVRYAACFVQSRHFRQLSTAIGLLQPLRAPYPMSRQVAEPTNALNSLTTRLWDGRAIFKTH